MRRASARTTPVRTRLVDAHEAVRTVYSYTLREQDETLKWRRAFLERCPVFIAATDQLLRYVIMMV